MATDIDGGTLVLYAVAAAVIGGTSLFGGKGKAVHALLGGLVIAAVYNGLGLLGVSAAGQDIATALVLLAAVTVDSLVRRRGAAAPERRTRRRLQATSGNGRASASSTRRFAGRARQRAPPQRSGDLHRAVQVAEGRRAAEPRAPGGRGHLPHLPCRPPRPAPPRPAARPIVGRPGSRGTTPAQPAGHPVAPGVEPGDELLAGVAPLGEADRALDQAGLGGDGPLVELASHDRDPGLDPAAPPRPPSPHHTRLRGARPPAAAARGGRRPLTPFHSNGHGPHPVAPPPAAGDARAPQRHAAPLGRGDRLDLHLGPQPEAGQPGGHRRAETRGRCRARSGPRPVRTTRTRAQSLPSGSSRRASAADPDGQRGHVLAALPLEVVGGVGAGQRDGVALEPAWRRSPGAGPRSPRPARPSAAGRAHGPVPAAISPGGGHRGQQGRRLVGALLVLAAAGRCRPRCPPRPAPRPGRRGRPPGCGWRWPCRGCPRSRGSPPPRRRCRAWSARGRR